MRSVKEGQNIYCGPAVLSILTGKDTDTCARTFESVTGRRDITEVYVPEILKALDKLKFSYVKVASDCSMYSLFIQIAKTDGMYIVVLPKHVVAVEVSHGKIYFCDNHTKEPISGAAPARLGQWCSDCYRTEAKPDPVFVVEKLRVEFNVYAYSEQSTVYIYRDSYFVEPNDDDSKMIGNIAARDNKELKQIRDLLLASI